MTEHPHLTPQHREKLEQAKAIAPDVIAEAGYRSIRRTDPFPASAGFADYQRADGYLLPIFPPDGTNGRYMLRRDVDRIATDRETGKQRTIKYEQAAGMPHHLHAPPRCRRWLGDVRVPIWFTEGIDKSNALASAGRCAVALPGVWVFKTAEILEKDWPLIALEGRTAIVAFDSDAATNANVAKAQDALAAFLAERGARVVIVRIPAKPDGEKVAVDDYLAQGGDLVDLLAKHADAWHSAAEGPCGRDVCRETRRKLAEERKRAVAEAQILTGAGIRPNRRVPYFLLVNRLRSDATRSRHPEAEPGKPKAWTVEQPLADEQGYIGVNLQGMAKETGVSYAVLLKARSELIEHGVFEDKAVYDQLPDGKRITRTLLRPASASPIEMVRKLATIVQAPSGWGGKREWRCPHHHEAKVELKRLCADCGADAELVEVTDFQDDNRSVLVSQSSSLTYSDDLENRSPAPSTRVLLAGARPPDAAMQRRLQQEARADIDTLVARRTATDFHVENRSPEADVGFDSPSNGVQSPWLLDFLSLGGAVGWQSHTLCGFRIRQGAASWEQFAAEHVDKLPRVVEELRQLREASDWMTL